MTAETAIYLIPVTLGDTPIEQVLPAYNRQVIGTLRHFIVENIRSARRFLKKVDPATDIDSLTFYELNRHTPATDIEGYLAPLAEGNSVGIISEAGCPAVADPGADVVAIAQRRGLKVVPLVGPSSIIMSVMASGFNGQSFAFHGYLPIEEDRRTARIKQLENRVYAEDQTQLFIETPYRNVRMMQDLLKTLRPQTRICLAANITCPDEKITTRTAAEWRKLIPAGAKEEAVQKVVPRVPAIFLIYK
jgi:16S rRNA (cytidine1402-2'-O)-methyltransferase